MGSNDVTLENYQTLAERTSATATEEGCLPCQQRGQNLAMQQVLLDLLKKATAVGEEADNVKRGIFYGKALDLPKTPISYAKIEHLHSLTALDIRLLHAGIGMLTEACEFLDALRNHFFHDRKLDLTNLAEECGDTEWYLAEAMNALGVTMQETLQKNIDKLRVRFPGKFTEENALNRDLDAERAVLE